MKFYTLIFIVVAMAVVALAEPEPEPAKASRYRAAQVIADAEDAEDNVDNGTKETDVADDSLKKGDASSGRLFLRKFLLFKNIFGNNQQQPVIPIIITGSGTNANASPTGTVTSTVTIPSGTGIVTTSPTATNTANTNTNTNTNTPVQNRRKPQANPRESYEANVENDAEAADDESGLADEQTIAAALAAGAQEYVVTDQEIQGTSDAKASRGPARVNLRRRGAQKGQVVSVRVPPQYRRYFKNGQRVIVNNRNRPAKRRVIKRRVNKKRNNKNKRRRVAAV